VSSLSSRVLVCVVGAFAFVGNSLVDGAPSAGAETFTVTSTADSGPDTLRQAFADASADLTGPHTIDIQVAAPIVLTSGPLNYFNAANQDLTIHGNGAAVIQTSSTNRVMRNDAGTGSLTVDSLTLSGGNPTNGGGGAIKSTGPLTVTNSLITSNRAVTGGGISGDAAVTVTDSTITDNHATLSGVGGLGGGGIETVGTVTVTRSTISHNTSAVGGGGITTPRDVSVTRSTVNGNEATVGGGGISSLATASVTNSTVTGNTAELSGGGVSAFDVNLVYATVASNTAPTGANIEIIAFDSLISFGSVVALPQGGGENCNFEESPVTVSNGFNFADDSSCGFTNTAQGDRQNAGDPALAALADNGGPTETRLPQTGSPLIDAIPAASCRADGASAITTDQRDVSRPQASGCDSGAVEVVPPAPVSPTPAPAAPVAVAEPRFTG
jgi:hypothetical protein